MNTDIQPSARAQVIARRTYQRPTNDAGTTFETWTETVDRVIGHQRWLWERALGDNPLNLHQRAELEELRGYMLARQAEVSGRAMWLGGTEVSRRRESSGFNCCAIRVVTVHDVVDAFWLLLQGCGVGFEPVVGTLNGFTRPAEIEVIRSRRGELVEQRGRETNRETLADGVWTLQIGDSAEAWAKAAGKIMAMKAPFGKIVLDFSQIRPAGFRLRGYGWISSGDVTLCEALTNICAVMNRRAGQLLDRIDILDVMTWLGTTLSSRRSAEIALVPYGDPQWREFAAAKKDMYALGRKNREQSNNSLMFYSRPRQHDLAEILRMMVDSGGSEPGFINAESALNRAPWFKLTNPCGEILEPDKGFCSLVENNLARFNGAFAGLERMFKVMARANYRQTCVNLRDGVLQSTWHELNEFLRLCGVGATGIVSWEGHGDASKWQQLRRWAHEGAHSMADELGLPRSKAITTIKPSGTMGKVMDTTEGLHRPLGKFIFSNISFSAHDPLLEQLSAAGYRVTPHPSSPDAVLARLPARWDDVDFDTDDQGRAVNRESAIAQLDRYLMVMDNYVDHNASITVSYDKSEIKEIASWIHKNWDRYVGVSFLPRNDASKTAADLGYNYLPQEVVTQEIYESYVAGLRPLNLDNAAPVNGGRDESQMSIDAGDECAGGVCPVR
jgi:ribonucleoside-triphosphate reductase